MIAQNDALDGTKKLGYRKFVLTRRKWPFGQGWQSRSREPGTAVFLGSRNRKLSGSGSFGGSWKLGVCGAEDAAFEIFYGILSKLLRRNATKVKFTQEIIVNYEPVEE